MEKYPKVVLLEFQFTNSGLIPPGAKRIVRNESLIIEKRRKNGVAPGEHGQGELVTVKSFVKQLFGLGYKIADIHFYMKVGDKTRGSSKTRFVLVVNFTNNGAVVCLRKEDVKILSQMIDKDAWGHLHQFLNPNGVMCVHCMHRVPDGGSADGVGEYIFEEPTKAEETFVYENVMQV